MNGKLVCLLAVFCVVLLADTEALRLRFRGRRLWNRIKKPVCKAVCAYTCNAVTAGSAAPICGFGCKKACDRKKRTTEENEVVIPLPRDFTLYDTNEDGQISIEEFAALVGVDPSRDDIQETFSFGDSDGDGFISESELLEAPWVFEDDDETEM